MPEISRKWATKHALQEVEKQLSDLQMPAVPEEGFVLVVVNVRL